MKNKMHIDEFGVLDGKSPVLELTNITVYAREDIFFVFFDSQACLFNRIDDAFINDEFEKVLDLIYTCTSQTGLAGVVFASLKPKAFMASEDFAFLTTASEEQLSERCLKMRKLLTSVRDLPVPTVAAISGDTFGTGVEFSLACDYRLVDLAFNPRFGFPFTSCGVMPCGNAFDALPRFVPTYTAVDLLFSSKMYSSEEWMSYGLIDETTNSSVTAFLDHTFAFLQRTIRENRLKTKHKWSEMIQPYSLITKLIPNDYYAVMVNRLHKAPACGLTFSLPLKVFLKVSKTRSDLRTPESDRDLEQLTASVYAGLANVPEHRGLMMTIRYVEKVMARQQEPSGNHQAYEHVLVYGPGLRASRCDHPSDQQPNQTASLPSGLTWSKKLESLISGGEEEDDVSQCLTCEDINGGQTLTISALIADGSFVHFVDPFLDTIKQDQAMNALIAGVRMIRSGVYGEVLTEEQLRAEISDHVSFDISFGDVITRQHAPIVKEEKKPYVPECPAGMDPEEYRNIMIAAGVIDDEKDSAPGPVVAGPENETKIWKFDAVVLTDTDDAMLNEAISRIFPPLPSDSEVKTAVKEGISEALVAKGVPVLLSAPFVVLSDLMMAASDRYRYWSILDKWKTERSDSGKKSAVDEADLVSVPMLLNVSYYPSAKLTNCPIVALRCSSPEYSDLVSLGLSTWSDFSDPFVVCEISQINDAPGLTATSSIYSMASDVVSGLRNTFSGAGYIPLLSMSTPAGSAVQQLLFSYVSACVAMMSHGVDVAKVASAALAGSSPVEIRSPGKHLILPSDLSDEVRHLTSYLTRGDNNLAPKSDQPDKQLLTHTPLTVSLTPSLAAQLLGPSSCMHLASAILRTLMPDEEERIRASVMPHANKTVVHVPNAHIILIAYARMYLDVKGNNADTKPPTSCACRLSRQTLSHAIYMGHRTLVEDLAKSSEPGSAPAPEDGRSPGTLPDGTLDPKILEHLSFPVAMTTMSPYDVSKDPNYARVNKVSDLYDVAVVQTPLIWLMAQGSRLVDSGVTSLSMLDLASTLILGVPPGLGGLFHHADVMGGASIKAMISAISTDVWPSPVSELVKNKGAFYPHHQLPDLLVERRLSSLDKSLTARSSLLYGLAAIIIMVILMIISKKLYFG